MGWFKTEEEIKESKIVNIANRRSGNPRQSTSRVIEEGEFVTIKANPNVLPVISFSEEELESEEEEDVSSINNSDISQ